MPTPEVDVLRAACCVAAVDGVISDREHSLLEKLRQQADVGPASLDAMKEMAQTDPNYYKKHFDIVRVDPERTLKVLAGVAMADGEMAEQEQSVLRHFAEKLGVSETQYEAIASEMRQGG